MRDTSFERLHSEEHTHFAAELSVSQENYKPEEYKLGDQSAPSPAHLAIIEAMSLLAQNPTLRLSDRLVGLPEDASSATKQFLSLVNGSRIRTIDESLLSFISRGEMIPIKDTCADAEPMFAGALTGVNYASAPYYSGESGLYSGFPVTIYVDEAQNPIFMKKYMLTHTALALQPFVVDNVNYPAGTITALRTKTKEGKPIYDKDKGLRRFNDLINGSDDGDSNYLVEKIVRPGGAVMNTVVRVRNAAEIVGVRPIRLSMWAHDAEEDRLLYALCNDNSYNGERKELAHRDIDYFRAVMAKFVATALASVGK